MKEWVWVREAPGEGQEGPEQTGSTQDENARSSLISRPGNGSQI